jgi:hypothetical protein
MRRELLRFCTFLCAAALILSAGNARADVVYDEGTDGDLSGDYLNPTSVNLSPGSNLVISSSGENDLGNTDIDMLLINIPAGKELTHLILTDYSGDSSIAFLGLQAGSAFTFNPETDGFDCIGACLGWSHFGPGTADGTLVGDNMLPSIGMNGIGFTPPLTGSQYTFWIQENGEGATYTLNFVVPEPATFGLFTIGGALTVTLTRRRRRQ